MPLHSWSYSCLIVDNKDIKITEDFLQETVTLWIYMNHDAVILHDTFL